MPNRQNMLTLDNPHPFFFKINFWNNPDGSRDVLAYVRGVGGSDEEAKGMGLAIDGSGSMKQLYGIDPVSKFLPKPPNHVEPVVQAIASFLAREGLNGKTAVIYWAVGTEGKDIQVIGDFTEEEAAKYSFGKPKQYGNDTYLLPALKYFTDGTQRPDFKKAQFGMYVFVTDGQIKDMADVIQYCQRLAKDIGAGLRNEVKLTLFGMGPAVDRKQLEELNNYDWGVDGVDLWDAQLADEISDLTDLFGEVVSKDRIVAPNDGVVKDEKGSLVANFSDTGLPAMFEFKLPAGATKLFTVDVAGNSIRQLMP